MPTEKGQPRYPVVLRHDREFLFLGISPLLSNKNKLLRHYAKLAAQTIAKQRCPTDTRKNQDVWRMFRLRALVC
jgi:hypothetical protein